MIMNQVDATILEVGVGGTYDCTNTVPRPIVTGVSPLGIDHVGVLGKTVGEIAWQKGGIFKVSVLVTLHHASYKNAHRKVFQR
jgi:folylpolyglutamate synthase